MLKKILSLLVLLFVAKLQVYAQNSVNELFKDANVFYLDRYEFPTQIKDSVYLVRVIKRDTTDQSLYTVTDYYLNGHRAMIGRTHLPFYNILKQGVFINYYLNGHKRSVENYEKGFRVGDGSYYYPNGNLYYVGRYDVSTKMWIINESRDSTGIVLATDGNGTHVEYDNDFKTEKGRGPVVRGLKQGKWNGIVNDTISYTCSYDKGNSYSGTSATKSGRIFRFGQDHVAPEFPGGEKLFNMFLTHNLHYPAKAKENNIQGKVLVSFVVGEDGKLSDVKALSGPGGGLDEEAVRVMKLSPSWQPCIEFGIVTKTTYTIPISFTLQQDSGF